MNLISWPAKQGKKITTKLTHVDWFPYVCSHFDDFLIFFFHEKFSRALSIRAHISALFGILIETVDAKKRWENASWTKIAWMCVMPPSFWLLSNVHEILSSHSDHDATQINWLIMKQRSHLFMNIIYYPI